MCLVIDYDWTRLPTKDGHFQIGNQISQAKPTFFESVGQGSGDWADELSNAS